MPWIDRRPFDRAGTLTILSVSLLHLYQGGMLLTQAHAVTATPLLALRDVLDGIGLHTHDTLGALLLATALVALAGAFHKIGWPRILFFVPQHFVLGVMALGGVWATFLGHYLDGTVIPWQHISADQAPMTALFLAHTAAILRRCWDPSG